jgi:hypothetical protein
VTLERYTKFGRVVRLEQDLRRTAVITVDESGQSVLDGERFEARPVEERAELPELPPEVVEAVAARIAAMLEPPLQIERLLITDGVARHRFECGAERNEWQDAAVRIHLAIAHPQRRLRALLDLGGTSFEERDLQEIHDTTSALLLPPASAGVSPGPLRLAPNVAAALWAAMATLVPVDREGMFSLRQTSRAAGAVDGRGRAITELTLIGAGAAALTNVFRPSYRARPAAAAFHIRATPGPGRVLVADPAEAIALLAPISVGDGSITMPVLLKRDGRSLPAEISRSLEEWCDGVTQVDAPERWYPFAAGALGSATIVKEPRSGDRR